MNSHFCLSLFLANYFTSSKQVIYVNIENAGNLSKELKELSCYLMLFFFDVVQKILYFSYLREKNLVEMEPV